MQAIFRLQPAFMSLQVSKQKGYKKKQDRGTPPKTVIFLEEFAC